MAAMVEGRGVYRILVGRPERKRQLGWTRRAWEDNVKMDLREMGMDGANWIRPAQDRVQWRDFLSTLMNIRFRKQSRLLIDKLSDYQLFKENPAPWSEWVSKKVNNGYLLTINFLKMYVKDLTLSPIWTSLYPVRLVRNCMYIVILLWTERSDKFLDFSLISTRIEFLLDYRLHWRRFLWFAWNCSCPPPSKFFPTSHSKQPN
jgi:hypothetical protein